jgi:hypothetical protein
MLDASCFVLGDLVLEATRGSDRIDWAEDPYSLGGMKLEDGRPSAAACSIVVREQVAPRLCRRYQ